MATLTAPTRRSGSRAAFVADTWRQLPVETWVLGCTVLVWIGLAFASPYFLTSGNVFNMMRQVSIDAIVAYGELFTIITAGIDLSVGSVLGLAGVAFALMLANGMSLMLAAPATLALGRRDWRGQRPRRRQTRHSGLHCDARGPPGLPRPHHARIRRHDRCRAAGFAGELRQLVDSRHTDDVRRDAGLRGGLPIPARGDAARPLHVCARQQHRGGAARRRST